MNVPKLIRNGEIRQFRGWNVRFAFYECPYCTKEFEANVSDIKRRRVRHCGCTNLKFSINKPLPTEVSGVTVLGDCGLVAGRRTAIFACPDCSTPFNSIVSDVKNKRKINCGCINLKKASQSELKRVIASIIKRRIAMRNKSNLKNTENTIHLKHIKNRIRCLIRRALIRNGYSKTTATQEILGCSMEDFYTHIERQFADGMGWHNRSKWHIDHIIPVSTAKSESELIALNHHTNLRPLWAKDNMSKGSKMHQEQTNQQINIPQSVTFDSIKKKAEQKRMQE